MTNNQPCIPCPPGAVCDGRVIPLDGHWGFLTEGQLEFIQCPNGFCCSRQTVPCTAYNTCATGRSGILCGSCSEGYAQSFFSKGCVLKSGVVCNAPVFAAYFIAVSFLYTIIFAFLPHIIEELSNKCAKKQRDPTDETGEIEDCDGMVIQVRSSSENTMESSTVHEPIPITAFITLVCFYLQVASLVHVNVQTRKIKDATDDSTPQNAFLKSLFNFFNFRFDLYRRVCPMDDLNLPIKESINVLLKVCSILNLLICYLIWNCHLSLKACISPPKTNSTERHENKELKDDETVTQRNDFQGRRDTKVSFASISIYNMEISQALEFSSIVKIGFVK